RQQRPQLAGEQERHEGVDDVRLQPLARGDVADPRRPTVLRAQIQRFAGLVALADREQLHKGLSTGDGPVVGAARDRDAAWPWQTFGGVDLTVVVERPLDRL